MSALRNGESVESAESTDAGTSDDTSQNADDSSDPLVGPADVEFGRTVTPAMEDISLHINPGKYVAIIGSNGSGRSTLTKFILSLLQPDEGVVRLLGEPAHTSDDGTRIGYAAQYASTSKEISITVREVMKMGRFPHVDFGRLSTEDHRIIDEALATVGISDFTDRRVTRFSGSQHQRAFIAHTPVGETDPSVLDEPTIDVDVESVDAFCGLFESLNEEGITTLLIEHGLGVATDHIRRTVYLNHEAYFDSLTDELADSDVSVWVFGTTTSLAGGSGSSSGTGGLGGSHP